MSAEELEAQARACADQGDVMKAIQLARQAIMEDPGRITLLDELAQAYAKRETPKALGTVATEARKKNELITTAVDVDIPLLSSLSHHAFVAMARRMPERSYEKGDVIVEEGKPGRHMFVIVEGRAAVHRGDQQLAVLGDGDFFGELALLTAQPRAATVSALEATRCFTVDKALLEDLSGAYPKVGEIARAFARERLAEAALLKSAIFSQLEEDARAALAEKFEVVNVDDGENVITEGEAQRGLFVVLAGHVIVTVMDEEVGKLGPGDIVGEISTLFGTSTTASVVAQGDVVVMRLSPEVVQVALAPYPKLNKALGELGQERWALI